MQAAVPQTITVPLSDKGTPRASIETMTAVYNTIKEASEPITAGEILAVLTDTFRSLGPFTLTIALRHLEKTGMITARGETQTERELRYKGRPAGRGARVNFYWAGGLYVPPRTSYSIAPNTNLFDGPRALTNRKNASKLKARPAKGKKVQTGRSVTSAAKPVISMSRPAKGAGMQTGRLERLESRIAQLEDKITQLTKALS